MNFTFTPKDLSAIYRRRIENWALSDAEDAQKIPRAERVARGKGFVRAWTLDQLPAIGNTFGWLKATGTTNIFSVVMPKHGVLKTTLTLNFARALAINGQRTLVIGLDIAGDITDCLKPESINSILSLQEESGLLSVLKTHRASDEVVRPTNLPTLSYIPESRDLASVEKSFSLAELTTKLEALVSSLRDRYDTILFDTSSHFSKLDQASVLIANQIIIPLACDVSTFRSFPFCIQQINDTLAGRSRPPESLLFVPTLRELNRLSLEIEASYRIARPLQTTLRAIGSYPEITETPTKFSVFETMPQHQAADDYFNIVSQIWARASTTPESSSA